MKSITEQNYYELLEIEPTASQEDILKAYNRARATYSNNSPALYSLFNKEEAQELLRLIDEAYLVLSNQYKRKQYDKTSPQQMSFVETEEKAIPEAVTAVPTLSSGKDQWASTRFGSYKVDENFEREIRDTEAFTGSLLQSIRMYKNVSLDQISEVTKISRPYLIAVEKNDYASLPAPVFVRGFLSQIAKILGLDPDKVTRSYMEAIKRKN